MTPPIERAAVLREVDALVAFHFFGWRWFQRKAEVFRCAFYPPDSEDWIRWNFHRDFEQIGEWPEKERRFADWDRCGSPNGYRENPSLGWLPRYSTDIAAAWTVVEKLEDQYALSVHSVHPGWNCTFMEHATCRNLVSARAETAPLAICLAALKSAGMARAALLALGNRLLADGSTPA